MAFVNVAVNDTDRCSRIIKIYNDELWRYNSAEPFKLLKEALKLAKKQNFLLGEYKSYGAMVGYCRNRLNLEFAFRFSREQARVALQMGDSNRIYSAWFNESINLRDLGKNDSCLVLQLRVKKRYENQVLQNKDRLVRIYSHISDTYSKLGNPDTAKYFAERSLQLREEINYGDGIDASLGQLCGIYEAEKNYARVQELIIGAIKNRKIAKDEFRTADYMSRLGFAQAMMGNFDSSITMQEKAIAVFTPERNINTLINVHRCLSLSYEKKGNPQKAFEHHKLFKAYADSIYDKEKIKSLSNYFALYDSEEKESTIQLLDQDKKIQEQNLKLQRYGLFFAGFVLIVVIIVSVVIYRAYKQKNIANRLLEEQKKIIEEKNKEVYDSINYAQRLQGAILLPEEELCKQFNEAFVLYMPKDIVSGDFYWFSESEHNRILAVADCTGHGVPGGFMSMLGYESLQDVALRENITTTSDALLSLDKKITQALNKTSNNFRDGMDIALCAFSKTGNTLQYSGANRPIIQVSNGSITEHKPTKTNIGGSIDGEVKEFINNTIQYQKGDVFYFFTDGYADQFGGPKGKKFKYKKLVELIQINHHLPLTSQKKIFSDTFLSWKGTLEQVDDVCVIGIRL